MLFKSEYREECEQVLNDTQKLIDAMTYEEFRSMINFKWGFDDSRFLNYKLKWQYNGYNKDDEVRFSLYEKVGKIKSKQAMFIISNLYILCRGSNLEKFIGEEEKVRILAFYNIDEYIENNRWIICKQIITELLQLCVIKESKGYYYYIQINAERGLLDGRCLICHFFSENNSYCHYSELLSEFKSIQEKNWVIFSGWSEAEEARVKSIMNETMGWRL